MRKVEGIHEDATSAAVYSDCGAYRYRLWYLWEPGRPVLLALMLNPSTATESQTDPTVERCKRRAQRLGFGGLEVANLFALRSTDPRQLYQHPDPVGPDNDRAILDAVTHADAVMCGWGNHGQHLKRGWQVLQMLDDAGLVGKLAALGLTMEKHPKHPLYVSYSAQLVPLAQLFGHLLARG